MFDAKWRSILKRAGIRLTLLDGIDILPSAKPEELLGYPAPPPQRRHPLSQLGRGGRGLTGVGFLRLNHPDLFGAFTNR